MQIIALSFSFLYLTHALTLISFIHSLTNSLIHSLPTLIRIKQLVAECGVKSWSVIADKIASDYNIHGIFIISHPFVHLFTTNLLAHLFM